MEQFAQIVVAADDISIRLNPFREQTTWISTPDVVFQYLIYCPPTLSPIFDRQ